MAKQLRCIINNQTQVCKPITIFALVMVVSSSFFSSAESLDAGIHQAGLMCGSYEYPRLGSAKLMQTFKALMDAVSFQIKEHGWAAESLLNQMYPMFALAQCHNHLDATHCYTCFTQARQLLSRCIPKVSGRVFLDGCFLRYDNYNFFNESVNLTNDMNVCDSLSWRNSQNNNNNNNTNNNSSGSGNVEYRKRVATVILNVTKEARDRRFAVHGEKDVFVLAQCWETLNKEECERCLMEAGKKVEECMPDSDGGRSLFSGCFIRYSTRKFYDDVKGNETKTDHDEGSHHRTKVIIASVSSAIAVALLIIIGAVLTRKKLALRGKRRTDFEALPCLAYNAGFTFKYDLLEKATNNFDPANKIGQGGAGSVFKGTLPSGRTVAVKRLFFNTRQWTDGFFNEAILINGIQHKNVVKLLGCSIEGPESLLVYEFVPNGSLDQILFGKEGVTVLTWGQRFQIICGIAEGIAYLHGGSGSKIIHRDIKSGNILLDENLNPKIADFGLARCVTENRSHVSTGIAGTLGYMAPEYLMRGQLTEKADVYAFGVLLVEIVCGKKNSVYTQGSTSVLHGVWKNYKAKNITASVDPSMHGKFEPQEASNALRAGLLCTQTSVTLRPSMSEVVQILTLKDHVIPSPKQQPFLNSTVLSPDDRTQTSTISTIVSSNGHTSARSSFHSTTSSLISNDDSRENSFSSSNPHFNTIGSPDSSIQVNIGAPEPR